MCSPYRGDTQKNIKFAQECCKHVVSQNNVPIAPHLYFPGFLNDENKEERNQALEMNKKLIEKSDEIMVFGDEISDGMKYEIDYATSIGKEIKYMSNVLHPKHYNIPGRKECIEEMVEKFGHEKTEAFCELNSYKYQYRHEMKNGQEDLDKASNYLVMLKQMVKTDPRFKIADRFGLEPQMRQLIEEMAELTQAISKYFRINGQGQPVSKPMNVEQNLIEEIADVKLVLDQVIYLMNCADAVQEVMKEKIKRIGEK